MPAVSPTSPHVNLFTRDGTQLTGVPVDGSWGGTLQVWEDVQGAPGVDNG